MRPADPKYRYVYAVWAFLELMGYGGIALGWGSLVYVLKEEGLYRNLCPELVAGNEAINVYSVNGSTAPHGENVSKIVIKESWSKESHRSCPAQDARLNLVFTVTSSFYCLAAFGLGHISYKYGTRVTRLTAVTLFVIGALAVVFTSNEVPWLIFPGMCLVAGGGIGYVVTNMQVAVLFPKGGPLLAGSYIGCFHFSSGIFLFMKFSHNHGISRRISFLILGLSHLLTLVSTFLFLPKDFFKKPQESGTDDQNQDKTSPKAEEKLPPLRSLVFSSTYLLHLYWTVVLQFRFMFVLSSLNITLENLFDSKKKVSQYTDITAYIMLGGFIVAPLVGAFYNFQTNRYRGSLSHLKRKLMPMVLPLAIGTTTGVAFSAVLFVRKPEIIYLLFLLLIIFRAFIYTMLTALPIAIYPGEYYGFLFGLNMVTNAVINLLQFPLFSWGTSRSFNEVNLLLLVLTASTYIHPLYQWWTVYKAESKSEDKESLDPDHETNGYQTFGQSEN